MTKEHREHIKEHLPHEEGEDVEAHQWVNRRIPSAAPQDEGVEEDVEGHFQPPIDPDGIER